MGECSLEPGHISRQISERIAQSRGHGAGTGKRPAKVIGISASPVQIGTFLQNIDCCHDGGIRRIGGSQPEPASIQGYRSSSHTGSSGKLKIAGIIRISRIIVQSGRNQFPGKGRIISGNIKTGFGSLVVQLNPPRSAHAVDDDIGVVSGRYSVNGAGNGKRPSCIYRDSRRKLRLNTAGSNGHASFIYCQAPRIHGAAESQHTVPGLFQVQSLVMIRGSPAYVITVGIHLHGTFARCGNLPGNIRRYPCSIPEDTAVKCQITCA